ncbi:MAG: TAG lipase/steryl ester hydrolase/phospholipase A2/LPA acyltransferase, partial [Halieaceae bacterium]
DVIQRYASVGPRTGVALNVVNGLLDQRFTGDINILPGNGVFSVGKLLSMLDEQEMVDLLKAGERATWPKVSMIRTTTRIGRSLDRILLKFELDEAHWLHSGPHTDAAGKEGLSRGKVTPIKSRRA